MRSPLISLWMAGLCGAAASAAGFEVTVSAPESGYPVAIVSAAVPGDFPEKGTLENEKGEIPFQKTGSTVAFVLHDLQLGEKRVVRVSSKETESGARAELKDGQILLSVGEKRVL